jgi:hypothetical protein
MASPTWAGPRNPALPAGGNLWGDPQCTRGIPATIKTDDTTTTTNNPQIRHIAISNRSVETTRGFTTRSVSLFRG